MWKLVPLLLLFSPSCMTAGQLQEMVDSSLLRTVADLGEDLAGLDDAVSSRVDAVSATIAALPQDEPLGWEDWLKIGGAVMLGTGGGIGVNNARRNKKYMKEPTV